MRVACDNAIGLRFQRAGQKFVVVRVGGDPADFVSSGNHQRVGPQRGNQPRYVVPGNVIPVAEARVAIGNPVACITRLGAPFRIIVVTDEGRSWWQRLWRGSVAYEVVRDAPTSVLDVR